MPTVNYNVCVHILLNCIWASDIKTNCNFGHVRLVISYTVCDNYDMLSIMMYIIGFKKKGLFEDHQTQINLMHGLQYWIK